MASQPEDDSTHVHVRRSPFNRVVVGLVVASWVIIAALVWLVVALVN
jgi:hypothetical protein